MDQDILCGSDSSERDPTFPTSITGPVAAGLGPETGPVIYTGRLYLLIAPRPAVDRLMDALAVRLALAAAGRAGAGAPLPYLHILDGGNRFDLHAIARGIAGGMAVAGTGGPGGSPSAGTGDPGSNASASAGISDPGYREGPGGSVQVEAILQRIIVARAFTCYQMEALLAAAAEAASTPGAGLAPLPAVGLPAAPVLAPGLLTTFADENVRRGERLRVLQRCLQDLRRLARGAPVLVSTTPLPAGADTAGFLSRLEAAADQVWRFEAQADSSARPTGLRPRPRSAAAPGQLRLF